MGSGLVRAKLVSLVARSAREMTRGHGGAQLRNMAETLLASTVGSALRCAGVGTEPSSKPTVGDADDWSEPEPREPVPRSTPAQSALPPAALLPVGTVLGRYRIESVLGQGGFGVVYDAVHIELRRRIALKVLRRELIEDAGVVRRFQQEARSA